MNKNIRQITYQGVNLLVSNRGRIYRETGEELEQKQMARRYWYCNIYSAALKKTILINVARAVCMAFHPIEGEDYKNL